MAASILVVAVVAVVAALTLLSSATPPSGPDGARGAALAHLDAHHDFPFPVPGAWGWTVEDITPQGLLGYSTWCYTQGGWTVEASYPVVLEPTYSVTIDYVQPGIGIPYHLHWEGAVTGGVVSETDYWLAQ